MRVRHTRCLKSMQNEVNKNTGRFYTSPALADLLASLVELPSSCAYAIDPMVGCGNLLEALVRREVSLDCVYGVDIDSEAIRACRERLPGGHFICGDAFDSQLVEFYKQKNWDIVIANPPFVRRERLHSADDALNHLSRAKAELSEILKKIGAPKPYIDCASAFTGSSDLAIPSAILCAALVKDGGALALVLPETCLKRSYGLPLMRLLESEFDIQVLVEDSSRSWFVDAQVKTLLLVAIKRWPGSTYRHISLSRSQESSGSLIGKVKYKDAYSYKALKELISAKELISTPGLVARTVRQTDLLSQSSAGSVASKTGMSIDFLTGSLEDWGLRVGQGLRTGANDFFYLEETPQGYSNQLLKRCAGEAFLTFGCEALLPVLKDQKEAGGVVKSAELRHRLLFLEHSLVDEDFSSSSDRELIKSAIWYAENNPINTRGGKRLIPEMSAVRTNGPTSEQTSAKYWYMLPSLKMRHTPDFAIPRVVGREYRVTLLPEDRSVVCDANFITLWRETDAVAREALFALLTSSLVQLQLECICSVLGGGALKIESADLKKLLLPTPTKKLIKKLAVLGVQMLKGIDKPGRIRSSVDNAILEASAPEDSFVFALENMEHAMKTLRDLRVKK